MKEDIKLSNEVVKDKWSETKKYYANNILICECETGGDYYCSVNRNGNPSNIRNKWKKTFRTRWSHSGLNELLGQYDSDNFKDDRPDLEFGYQGSVVTAKKIKELLGIAINKNNQL